MRKALSYIGFAVAVVGSLRLVPTAANQFEKSVADEDLKARRRELALQDTSPAPEEDVAFMERLLSKQIFRIDDDVNENNDRRKARRNQVSNIHYNNPLSRALKKSRSSVPVTSKQGRRSGRRRTIGGRFADRDSDGGGGFLSNADSVGDMPKVSKPDVEEKEEKDAEEPVDTTKSTSLREPDVNVADTTRTGDSETIEEEGPTEDAIEITRTYYADDDYYRGSKKGGYGSKKGGHYYDDDIYYGPTTPDLIPLKLEAFQDSRDVETVLNGPEASAMDPGTQFMYANEPLFPVYLDKQSGNDRNGRGYVVDDSLPIATVSGKCTRIDPNTGDELYTGRAYCQYDYHFLDEIDQVEAEITAEGVVQIGEYSTLSVTGGSGIFRRTVGTVMLYPGDIGFESNPIFIPNDGVDLPANYLVEMYVWLDSLVLPGEGVY